MVVAEEKALVVVEEADELGSNYHCERSEKLLASFTKSNLSKILERLYL